MKILPRSVVVILFSAVLFCGKLPVTSINDPTNVSIAFFTESKNHSVPCDSSLRIGLMLSLPQHISSIQIQSSCGNIDTIVIPDADNILDTFFFEPLFVESGPCTLYATATLIKNQVKVDSLIVNVSPEAPRISFSTTPHQPTTHTGKIDTLLYVTSITGGITSPYYEITADPDLDTTQLFKYYSAKRDSVWIIFDPSVADTYTITITAMATVDDTDTISDSVSISLQVFDEIAPSSSDPELPHTFISGITDTCTFTIDNTSRPDSCVLQLITEALPDTSIVMIIPSGTDSLRIAITPPFTKSIDTVQIGIRTDNGILSDTTWYQLFFSFQEDDSPLWTIADTAINVIEGHESTFDLRDYFDSPKTGSVTFISDLGHITDDTVWEWTPPWGSDDSIYATITAINGNDSFTLTIEITVTEGDSSKPLLLLADSELDGKTVSTPQIAVPVFAFDSDAGIADITMSYNDTVIKGVLQHDSLYSGVITQLAHGEPTEIIIVATDKSMRGNRETLSLTLTYDSTALDHEPPVFRFISGPKNGDRIAISHDSVLYSITDTHGIDSVWSTLDGQPHDSCICYYDDSIGVLTFTFTEYGKHTVRIYATDKSMAHNTDSTELELTYNVHPLPMIDFSPKKNAVEVDVNTAFTCTGGNDPDGDTVYYHLLLGTSMTSLSIIISGATDFPLQLPENSLTPDTRYFWRIVAFSKAFPDTVKSDIMSFRTVNEPPKVLLTSPESGAVHVNNASNLQWSAEDPESKPMHYWVHIDSNLPTILTDGITSPELSEQTWPLSRIPSGCISGGRKYYWTVIAVDNPGDPAGKSDTAAVDSFYTENSAPQWRVTEQSDTSYYRINIDLKDFCIDPDGHMLHFYIASGNNASISGTMLSFTANSKPILVMAKDNFTVQPCSSAITFKRYFRDPQMKFIPSKNQTFLMGLVDEVDTLHSVTFTYNFWMDSTEVTQKQYTDVMTTTNGTFKEPAWDTRYGGKHDRHPAFGIAWIDAIRYCNALSKAHGLDTVYFYTAPIKNPVDVLIDTAAFGYRLPFEAEWEFACKSRTTTDYLWGSDDGIDYAWCKENNDPQGVKPVAQKIPNAFQLYDMCGNVRELCNDYFLLRYKSGDVTNPIGPLRKEFKEQPFNVVRGGCWEVSLEIMKTAKRTSTSDFNYRNGFRVCLRE